MVDNKDERRPGREKPRSSGPEFTSWDEFQDVSSSTDVHPGASGLLFGTYKPTKETLPLLRDGFEDDQVEQRTKWVAELVEQGAIRLRDRVPYFTLVPKSDFDKALNRVKKREARQEKKRLDLSSTPPGIWMTVEEAAERTPGGAEKAREWLWEQRLPRDLAGTRFVLTEEWIAALHRTPKAARGKSGGE